MRREIVGLCWGEGRWICWMELDKTMHVWCTIVYNYNIMLIRCEKKNIHSNVACACEHLLAHVL